MENEKRLINESDLLKKQFLVDTVRGAGYVVAVEDIAETPTVDAAPVVHGRWEQVQRWATKAKYRCSVCGREIMSATKVNIEKYPYCHCGAKMDGGNEDG